MQPHPRASIIVSAYNRPQVVTFAINSVLNSDFDDWELIVIGDGCNEATAKAVLAFTDARISFYNLPENTGSQSEPHNEGVRRARGDYVLFLNQDDLYFPDHISRFIAFMDDTGAEVAWAPVLLLRKVVSLCGPPSVERDIVRLDGAITGTAFDPTRFVISSSWCVRRETCLAVGPWLPIEATRLSPSQEWLFRAFKQGRRMSYHRAVSVLCIHSGTRRFSYISPRSIEHERAWEWIQSGLQGRVDLLNGLAVQQAEEIIWQMRRRPLQRLLYVVGKSLAKAGIHPSSARRLVQGKAKGDFVLTHRHFTSQPPQLAAGAVLVLSAPGAGDFLGEGWHAPASHGRWTSARAELFFSLPAGHRAGSLELKGRPRQLGDETVLTLSDGTIVHHVWDQEDGTICMRIQSPGPFRLEISTASTHSSPLPGNAAEARAEGCCVACISFIEDIAGR